MTSLTAFVTGGTGFLGSHLIKSLRTQGFRVFALIRPQSFQRAPEVIASLRSAGAQVVTGNLLDLTPHRPLLEQSDLVFHLAGRLLAPGVPESEYRKVHVEAVASLLQACQGIDRIQKIVLCSSTGVFGPTGLHPRSEEGAPLPSNIYESTKAEGEQLALDLTERLGLPLTIIRPALVYGPGDLHLLGWFRAIQGRYYWVVGDGNNLLHPIYIQDVIDGMLACALSSLSTRRIYHLAGEEILTIRQIAEAIARALDKSLPVLHLPTPVAYGLAAFLEALPGIQPARLPLTRQRVRFMTQSRVYSSVRSQMDLNFSPKVDFATGVRRTVDWYRSQGYL